MRVPEMKSKSLCLHRTKTGEESAQPARTVSSTALLPCQVHGWKPRGTGGARLRLHAWVYDLLLPFPLQPDTIPKRPRCVG